MLRKLAGRWTKLNAAGGVRRGTRHVIAAGDSSEWEVRMFGNFVDLVGGLSAGALVAVFVVGALLCYLFSDSAAFFIGTALGIIAGIRIHALTGNLFFAALAFMVACGVYAFVAFLGHVKKQAIARGGYSYSTKEFMQDEFAAEKLLKGDWVTYSSPLHDFVADFPSTPKVSTDSKPGSGTTRYVSDAELVRMRLSVIAHPKELIGSAEPSAVFRDWRASLDSFTGSVVRFDDSIDFQGHPAAQAELRLAGGNGDAHLLLVPTDCCTYEFTATPREALGYGLGQVVFYQFVDSFRFVEGS